MGKHPSKWVLSCISLFFLALVIVLSGCARAGLEDKVASTSVFNGRVSEEPGEPLPTISVKDATEVPPLVAIDATGTALSISQAAERIAQTLSAQSTATQAAHQAIDALAVTATEGSPPESEFTPALEPGDAGLPTPTPDSLMARYFEPLTSFDSVLPGLLTDLRASPDGTLWAINENGIASLRGSTWTVHFPEVILRLAGFDDARRAWVLNEAGTAVLSWNGSEWRIYGEGEGWLPIRAPKLFSQAEEMVSDRNGRVWMTAFHDVRSFDGTAWTVLRLSDIGFEPYEETADTDGFYFPAIEKDLQGNIWIGNCDSRGEETAGQGARWFDGDSWQGNSDPTSSGCVKDIEVDPDGRIWMGIDDLLWRFAPETKTWTSFELPEPPADLRTGWVEEIQFGPDGNPWLAISLCGGASCGSSYRRYRLQEEEWVSVPLPHEDDPGRLFLDPVGIAWFYIDNKLYRIQGSNLDQILDLEICCITQDSRGWLYLAAKQGQMKLIFIEKGSR